MLDPFQRMQNRLFARLGEQAILRGEETIVIITDGVATYGEHGQLAAYRSTAALPAEMNPKGGDPLVVGVRSFVVDQVLAADGYQVAVVLREHKP